MMDSYEEPKLKKFGLLLQKSQQKQSELPVFEKTDYL